MGKIWNNPQSLHQQSLRKYYAPAFFTMSNCAALISQPHDAGYH